MTILVLIAILLLFAFKEELWTVVFGLILGLWAFSIASPIEILFSAFSWSYLIASGMYILAVIFVLAALKCFIQKITGYFG